MLAAPTLIETAVLALQAPVANSMVFTQTDGLGIFLMDDSQTFGQPDPPQLANTEMFTIGGLWTQPVVLDHMEFQCHLFGVLVYDESFTEGLGPVDPGFWSYSLPFDVPPVAPSTTYYITVKGIADDGSELFSIDTNFRFA